MPETETAAAELRQLTREAHEAVRDLYKAIDTARAAPRPLLAEVEQELHAMLGDFRGQVEQRMLELTQTASAGLPVKVLCNTCGRVVSTIADLTVDVHIFRCPNCRQSKRILVEDVPG